MAKSISSIIDRGFINSFTGLAKGDGGAAEIAKALNGQGASQVSISSGLRLGAQAFGTAVQNLNSLVTFINVSENTLQRLGKITDRFIEITERATKSSTGISERRTLVGEFEELATEFRQIVSKAKIGKRKLLEQGDIEELFITLGLEPDKSKTLAAVFSRIETFDTERTLVNPEQGNTDALKIPASAFVGPKKVTEIGTFTQSQITNSASSQSYLMQSETIEYDGSTLSSTGGGEVLNVDKLLSVNAAGTYSVIQSNDDYLGYNGSGFNQLYLVDTTGAVVTQLTTNDIADTDYLSADVSSDGTSWTFYATNSIAEWVVLGTNAGDLTDPADHNFTIMDSNADGFQYQDLKISSDGSFIAYHSEDFEGTHISLRDTATNTLNNSLYNQVDINVAFGFIDTDELAIARFVGDKYNVISYKNDTTSALLTANLDSIADFTTVERGLTANSAFYFAFNDSSAEQVNLYKEGAGLAGQHSITGGTPSYLQLLPEVSGNESVRLGLFGILPGDADTELYDLSSTGTQEITTQTRLAPATQEIGDILNSARKLLRRPDAYRLLHDLQGLKDQIDTNLKALESARLIVQDNISLVRATGLAFLELSDQISDSAEADEVARLLRAEIRKSPVRALAQAENLQNIAVAALTATSEDEEGELDS